MFLILLLQVPTLIMITEYSSRIKKERKIGGAMINMLISNKHEKIGKVVCGLPALPGAAPAS